MGGKKGQEGQRDALKRRNVLSSGVGTTLHLASRTLFEIRHLCFTSICTLRKKKGGEQDVFAVWKEMGDFLGGSTVHSTRASMYKGLVGRSLYKKKRVESENRSRRKGSAR